MLDLGTGDTSEDQKIVNFPDVPNWLNFQICNVQCKGTSNDDYECPLYPDKGNCLEYLRWVIDNGREERTKST